MHLATYKCQVDVLNFLLKQPIDADVNTRDGCSGRTLLHHAVEANNQSLVLFLINVCGAEVSAMTYDGSTPMKLAEGRGLQHLVRILMHYGADQSQILTDSDSDSSSDEEMVSSNRYLTKLQGSYISDHIISKNTCVTRQVHFTAQDIFESKIYNMK